MDRNDARAESTNEVAIETGRRLRTLRRHAQLSIRAVSERAGVDKNTVLRLEQGHSVRASTLAKVCEVYGILPVVPGARTAPEAPGETYALHRLEDDRWFRLFLTDEHEPSVITTTPNIQRPEARLRLGHARLANQFMRRLECSRAGGSLKAAVFEVFGTSGWSRQSSGEALIFAVRGALRFHIGDESVRVEEGTAVTFDRTCPHMHEPAEPLKPGDSPCLLFYVQVD